MSDRRTLIVYLKVTYEKHREKISIAALIFACLVIFAALITLIVLLYQNYYGL